jgi:uncharacterized Zn finger protein (UPF0148 family)
MRCSNDGNTLKPHDGGFLCPVCGFKAPYSTKKRHETKRHEKKPTDGEQVFVSRG